MVNADSPPLLHSAAFLNSRLTLTEAQQFRVFQGHPKITSSA